jgi:predicted RNA binding protein with dsRBD fold (UPF0201 family)
MTEMAYQLNEQAAYVGLHIVQTDGGESKGGSLETHILETTVVIA